MKEYTLALPGFLTPTAHALHTHIRPGRAFPAYYPTALSRDMKIKLKRIEVEVADECLVGKPNRHLPALRNRDRLKHERHKESLLEDGCKETKRQ